MWLNVFISVLIILPWIYTGALSYSFYSSSLHNHYKMKHLYSISILNVFQAVLGIIYILGITERFQSARWLIFTFIELMFLFFVLRSYSNRHFELVVTSFYTVILVLSTLWLHLIFNVAVVLILILLCLMSKDKILQRWFTWSFVLYGLTSIVPNIFTFTGTESLLVGLIFTVHFSIGVIKIYRKEKVDDNLKKLLLENKL